MVVQGEDRISNLPEDVVVHILSFLETRYTVRTSALSKRWKNLCYFVPSIIVHLADLYHNTDAGLNCLQQSISFIARRLRYGPCRPIRKFVYTCGVHQQIGAHELLKDWLIVVTRAGVRQLCLEIPYWSPDEEVFNCETLVELKLGHEEGSLGPNLQYLPGLIHLPNLKILHLRLRDISIDVAERLFTNFPQLESLTLVAACSIDREFTFNISSSNLKHLALEIYPLVGNCKHKVVIDAPLLETLWVVGFLNCFHSTTLPSIEEAYIHIGRSTYSRTRETAHLQLPLGISSVKSMPLTASVFEGVDYCEGPLFLPNLTQVVLKYFEKSSALELLRLMPNLVYLKLISEYYTVNELSDFEDTDDDDDDNDDDDNVPSCLPSRMKVIEIEDNYLWRSHMPLVKYLLKNAMVLDRMVFDCEKIDHEYYYSDSDDEDLSEGPEDYLDDIRTYQTEVRTYQTEILECTRGSKTCEIEFLGAMQAYPVVD